MLDIGLRSIGSLIGHGTFDCPHCREQRAYHRKSVRTYLCVWLIPIVPFDVVGQFSVCQTCFREFDDQAIGKYEDTRNQKVQTEYFDHLKRIMILTVFTDSEITESASNVIRSNYLEITGEEMTQKDVERELYLYRLSRSKMAPYTSHCPVILNDSQSNDVIRAVVRVAQRNGSMSENARRFLDQVAADMRIMPPQLNQLLQQVRSE